MELNDLSNRHEPLISVEVPQNNMSRIQQSSDGKYILNYFYAE